jgi:hypothetical protein
MAHECERCDCDGFITKTARTEASMSRSWLRGERREGDEPAMTGLPRDSSPAGNHEKLPIDEAALKRAINSPGIDPSMNFESTARVIVAAYLEAVGATVETMEPDPRSMTQFAPQQRVVTPWKPLTDMEEERK